MRDIDLLVRAADGRPAVDALQAASYAFEVGFVPVDQHLHAGRVGGRDLHEELGHPRFHLGELSLGLLHRCLKRLRRTGRHGHAHDGAVGLGRLHQLPEGRLAEMFQVLDTT